MAVNIHINIIELNALHTKRQNLFQELDAVIHLLMEAKHWGLRKSRNATSLNSRFKSLDTLKVKIISVTFRRVSKEIQYLNAKGALTYTDIAGDPVLYGNLPPREISMKDVFRSGDSSKKFKIAEGQWYRYAPSYVSPAYHLL